MQVFAIADPHLSRAYPKPMNIFGGNWEGHPEVFFDGWRKVVTNNDLVILAGDISWAMHLPQALLDLQDIAQLPGQKVLLRGNHDYWWASISKLRAALPSGMLALQNDAVQIGPITIAGSRGWDSPGTREFTPEDQKVYNREVERLRLSLQHARRLGGQLIMAMHFPPFGPSGEATGFTQLIDEYRPHCVVYGHLHGADPKRLPQQWNGVPLHLVAADALSFCPKLIWSALS